MTTLHMNPSSIDDYRKFIAIKSLPSYSCRGREMTFPDEYNGQILGKKAKPRLTNWEPSPFLFDYQRDIVQMALRKRKYAIFADCGAGKTLMFLEWLHAVRTRLPTRKRALIVSPLMVIPQTMDENERWYSKTGFQIEHVRAAELQSWLGGESGIGITNYDALTDEITQQNLGALILDESSMLKSHYGKWGQKCIELGRGLNFKLACTGTPAPNDRIEYANHAVFLEHFPTVNSFLARFFINRGQTQNRWELKQHALAGFYRALSHWCIFLTNPATYGWKDNTQPLPPINVHIDHVPLTPEQSKIVRTMTGNLVVTGLGGITSRSTFSQLAKGVFKGEDVPTRKFTFIKGLVDSFGDKSTIIWCHFNDEQDRVAAMFPDAANIDGSTPVSKRIALIDDFKSRRRRVLISKPKILGFGLNLQVATKQVFSGLQDSYEEYYQAVKRSNRYGATEPLDVHIPVTELEEPFVENVLRKAGNIARDTEEQERIFREYGYLDGLASTN